MLDLYKELKVLIEALNERGVDYALCGGLALAVHGVPRATVDIDLLVPKAKLKAVAEAAQQQGFNVDSGTMSFAQGKIQIRRLLKTDREAGDFLALDLIVVTTNLQEIWKTRETIDWLNRKLTVLSKHGLIEMKKLRGSGRDIGDIEELQKTDEK